MEGIQGLIDGFALALTPINLLWAFVGVVAGTFVGVLPGIGPALTIALLLPLTYTVAPEAALILFAGIYYGAMYGGSTTSILLNTPGESGSMMTAIDGNKMARSGRAASALATAAIGSFIAGTIATVLLAFVAPYVVRVAILLGPADYLALIVVAFMTVGALLGASAARGFAAVAVGLVIGLIGFDSQSGVARYTFGVPRLLDGIDSVVVIVALFAMGEAIYLAARMRKGKLQVMDLPKGQFWMTRDDWRRSWPAWLRGTAIGWPLGAVPVGGSEVPTFLSYAAERRLSKRKDEFGKGAIEGVAGPEAANNANAAGALMPLLALGVPTSATAGVILIAFQQYGIQPGPRLLSTEPDLVWGLIAALLIGNFMLLVLNLPLAGVWAKVLKIPTPYLYASIVTFALLGAYAVSGSIFDVFTLLVIGILGYFMRQYGFPIAPLIIGVILGPIAEQQLRRALAISDGDASALVASPFSIVCYVLVILVAIVPRFLKRWERRTAEAVGADDIDRGFATAMIPAVHDDERDQADRDDRADERRER
ncbi:tripartite tricarboxylate transporter permease [Agrococcus terreus]|uniref:Tripartite tricarboxylate transporter TctA n=1 Tax=Agrococcus terreus TaxID=574649 RepID=A0ABQ2KL01_9MICO|nr:tripartite tricarboxylate transporter permease [Agrococcus terreus]GGN84985.1 tripartite tricarboxylate transporter TctA [Agrococcus terreus]